MKKTFKIYAICWAILLVLFHMIAFLTPNKIAGISKFSGGFLVGYVFIIFSFIGQFVCAYYSFKQENLQKFFYHVSLITISYSAMAISVIIGVLCMALPFIPAWAGAITCLLILGFNAVSILKAKAAIDIVSEIDEKTKIQTFFIKSLTADAEALLARAKSDSVKAELKKVCQAVRYSDPMSTDALSDVESQITLKFATLSKSAETDNMEEVKNLAEELLILINDRNKKCKLLK